MIHAYVFPGQGSQFSGMGKELFESSTAAQALFNQANEILGFNISEIMFGGSADELKQTKVTQPAVFLHSVIKFLTSDLNPSMVAGHSLGELSALVANKTLSFEDGLRLVALRANAMQKACELNPSTMAAILNLDTKIVEDICASISNEVVVAANYNCPGQLVISGSINGIHIACEKMKEAGAKRALVLPVGGAFHSPLMEPAKLELQSAIENTAFSNPICPIYQNVNAQAVTEPDTIKENLIRQLTAPVLWSQTVEAMRKDGAVEFTEVGPGNVLQGLIKKISADALVNGLA